MTSTHQPSEFATSSVPPVWVDEQQMQNDQRQTTFALQASGIAKSYVIGGQSRPVLDGIDFQLGTGECVFLTGPSGSGKSTLLSILGLLLTPDAGELRLCERRVDGLGEVERTLIRRERIGFVFQRFQLIDGLDATDNVAIPLTLDGMNLAESRQLANELLCRIGLEDHRHALPSSMSPGQCQRVALARAVIRQPELILADEPTAALDSQSGQSVMELLRELTTEFLTSTVVVTHDPRIYHYADRICEMENGRFK
ncbi:ABC transporter ATP-binding protein [Stieleria sp. TO1_6]|uniref:ABC transporter ATP-binding protein n=1 Tax=Stieleria tagensis TaxID=2956795 RepID=UPI00209AE56F|nr:ABC transporter ATP-binding protein [Stieleria tagensis]MCO8122477.1 ABC transporter ATP-binding protein [Stieleria tagensis]